MKWKLITEENTPSDEKSIEMSFNKDVSDEKYTPTVEFVRKVYNKMNKELFLNFLPMVDEIDITIKQLGETVEVGSAYYTKRDDKQEITPKALVLNSSYKFTLHGWMEIILHELIHVCDYMMNPDHFYDKDYKPHGEWFMNQGRRFKKYGFNVTEKCGLDLEINKDMEEVEKMDKPNKFIVYLEKTDKRSIWWAVRIEGDCDKDKVVEYLRGTGVKKAFVATTDNPRSNKLDFWNADGNDVVCSECFNKLFIDYYGPFTRKELLDMSTPIAESEEDELDKYMKIARQIEGVVSVERKGDEVIVGIA